MQEGNHKAVGYGPFNERRSQRINGCQDQQDGEVQDGSADNQRLRTDKLRVCEKHRQHAEAVSIASRLKISCRTESMAALLPAPSKEVRLAT